MPPRSCLALAWSVAALVLLPASAGATMPGNVDGRVSFVLFNSLSGNDGSELYSARPNGDDRMQLTHNPGAYSVFSDWSPKGDMIAFDSDRTGNPQVYTMPPTGDAAGLRQITDGPGFHGDPAWSPDAQWIFFEADWGDFRGSEGIYVLPATADHVADKSQARLIDLLPTDKKLDFESEPQLSPDGTRMVFTRFRLCKFPHHDMSQIPKKCESAIFIKNADGTGKVKQLTPWDLNASAPDWAPDGSAIVFDSKDAALPGDKPAIFRMKPDGGGRKQIAPKYPGVDKKDPQNKHDFPNNPVFAPKGDRVMYVRFLPDHGELWTISPFGGGASLAFSPGLVNKPDWGVNTP